MANQEHLAFIEQGVAVWNEWYQQHKRVIPDLTKANLSNLNLSGINLKKAKLAGANFSNSDLTKAQLVNSDLSRANLLGADLQAANLKGANLDYAILSLTRLNNKTIIPSKSRRVWEIVNNQISDQDFTGVDLSKSNLFRADLSNTDLSHAKLEGTNLNSAKLSNAYLYKADLTAANLQNADLQNAYFSQANLTKAQFSGAKCCGAYFKDAELKLANLKQAKFSQKTMIDLKWYSVWEIVNRGAVKRNLSGADLSYANLQGVNFADANLTNANLSHAILSYGNLERANLTNTDLVGANVSGVDLERANLKGAKLRAIVGRDLPKSTIVRSTPRDAANVLVKERPTTLQVVASSAPHPADLATTTAAKPLPAKKKTNFFGLFFLGLLASVLAIGYIYLGQNPNLTWREIFSKLQLWQEKVEQLIPVSY